MYASHDTRRIDFPLVNGLSTDTPILGRHTFIGCRPKYELTTHSSTMIMDDHTHAHTPMSCDDRASMQCNYAIALYVMSYV